MQASVMKCVKSSKKQEASKKSKQAASSGGAPGKHRARGGRDILDIPPLISLADMDKRPGRFEGSLHYMAK